VSWSVEAEGGVVTATFVGHLTEEDGVASAVAFAAELGERKQAVFVVDEM